MDATNELTYLLLKSKREFPTHYPDLAVRVHARTPQRLLWDVAETIKQGQGYPKLLNDEELIPRMLAKGAPASEVFDYVVSGWQRDPPDQPRILHEPRHAGEPGLRPWNSCCATAA